MNQKTDGHGEESPASAAKTAKGKKGRKGRKFLYAVVQGSTGVLREYCIPTEASRSQHWYVVGNGQAVRISAVVRGRSGDSSLIIRGIGVNHPSRLRIRKARCKGMGVHPG